MLYEGEAYSSRDLNFNGVLVPVLKTVNHNSRAVRFKEPSSSRGTILYSSDGDELYHVEDSITTDLFPSTDTSED